MSATISEDGTVLDRARLGDEDAFDQLTRPYTAELRLHCCRLVGSLLDAEDQVQETLLAAWLGLAGFEGRASLRAWLYRIATNRCLNWLRAASRRPRPEPIAPFQPPEPSRWNEVAWLQPYPDAYLADSAAAPGARLQAREAVELAFVTGLQRLAPRQAAALILSDVLGYSTAEVADLLESSRTAVKGLLQRARASVDKGRSPGPEAPAPGTTQERLVADRFAEAFMTDDIDGIVALLTDDAWLAMPPAPHEYQGRSAIADFLRASAEWRGGRRFSLVPTRANSQPAFGCYLSDPETSEPQAAGVIVLTLAGNRIRTITRFFDEQLLGRFGLPQAPAVTGPVGAA